MNNPIFTLTATLLAGAVGAVITVVSVVIPRFNVWFAAKDPGYKRAVMSLIGLVVSGAIVGFSCFTAWVLVPCVRADWWRTLIDIAFVWVGYVMGNEPVYQIIPKPLAVVAAITAAGEARDIAVAEAMLKAEQAREKELEVN